ncbi:uncharacterized protein LOC108732898 [Agrilus planipennis]|uniref:Uncharacterized protein LOC108732898 n=1 Tax=Agrilus planipennis TaxID=224129 RepID=A0A1W4WH24_AGRPL|nr:uncharacterized protein LOC108732898 [Agrilus planipennis]
MKSATKLRVMCLIFGLGVVQAKPLEDSEVKRATRPPIGETIQQLTNQLIDQNGTLPNTTITLDTRTPPRVKQQMKNHHKLQHIIENSHPGMAIPADESEYDFHLEEATKKATIYKLEIKPTTEKGLSTWVLLNSQTVSPSTARPTIKPIIKLTTKINEKNVTSSASTTESSYKPIKPFFKKRPATTTTTKKPSTTTKMMMPITKLKFSVLQSVKNKTQNPISSTATTSSKTTLTSTTTSMTAAPTSLLSSSSPLKSSTTTFVTKAANATKSSEITSTTALPAEAKQGEVELSTTATDAQKKNRKSPPKKKKNKNRRRRPSSGDKSANGTEIADKIGHNNGKPIGTQIYNYLSREIMPTVGVGLVGLMVTAGLASYFLYPFGTLRRSYEIERKDVKGGYYYDNDYSIGGVAEEDMISKVVAGMPENQGLDMLMEKDNFYKKTDKNEKTNVRTSNDRHKSYRDTIDAYVPQNNYGNFDDDAKIQSKPSDIPNSIYNSNKQFVVGAITKKILEVTPAAVPEHGPRSLNRRKRSKNDIENEIHNYQANEITSDAENTEKVDDFSTTLLTTTEDASKATTEKSSSSSESSSLPPCSSTKQTEIYKPTDTSSIMQVLRDLIELKIKLGLEMMRNTTMTISRYFHEVQKKFESRRKRH